MDAQPNELNSTPVPASATSRAGLGRAYSNADILKAGWSLRDMLLTLVERKRVTQIYPVIAPEATLPYIVFRRGETSNVGVKGSQRMGGACGSPAATYELMIYSASYGEGIQLAQTVIGLLDGWSYTPDPMVEIPTVRDGRVALRSVAFTGSDGEDWEAGAFVQHLTFAVKL